MTPHTTSGHTAGARGWSEEAVLQLRALWGLPGLSAAAIAERLGVSRNAVLGKAHRLGLSKPHRPGAPAKQRRAEPRPLVRPPLRRAAAPVVAAGDLGPQVARLEDLPAHACHWPIGDPSEPGFGFCGRPAPERVYCDPHWRRAHGPG